MSLIHDDTLAPNDSFRQKELLCEISPPKILLNGASLNDTDFDLARKLQNLSFSSQFDWPSTTSASPKPVQLYKSHGKTDNCNINNAAAYADSETKSSAYFSDASSSFFWCQSHADGYECDMHDSVLESTLNSSGYQGSLYNIRDSMDDCYFRKNSSKLKLKEPSTPTNQNYHAHELNINVEDSLDFRSGTAPADKSECEMIDEREETMDSAFDDCNDDAPVDLNNTLDRINDILAKGGFKTPSPTRMERRKHLMKEYVSDLLQQETSNRNDLAIAKKSQKYFRTPAKPRRSMKRTISVDQQIQMFEAKLQFPQ